jgi:hypothetical protein
MFSKQKIKLLDKSRFKKYLAYAFGEVLLIVIGISIAVFINKRVEQNNRKDLLQTILVNIKNDLETDLREVDILLDNYKRSEPFFDYVLDSLEAGRSMKDCLYCPQVLTNAMPFSLRTRGYQQLNDFKEDRINNTDSLIFNISNFYNSYTKLTEVVNKLLLDDTDDNLNYLKVNYEYFRHLFTDKEIEGRMDFFENNIEFVNRVALREILNYANHVQLLESYKEDSKSLLEDISNKIE